MAIESIGLNTGTTAGVVVVAGSANAKGSATTISASVSNTATGLFFTGQTNTPGAEYLMDILINDVVKVANLVFSGPAAAVGYTRLSAFVPCPVTAGQSVKVQLQSSTGSAELHNVAMYLVNQFGTGGTVATLGANTTDSGGTSVDPGGTAHTAGAWSQLTASAGQAAKWVLVSLGNQNNTARADGTWFVTIGTGTGGAEVALISNLMVCQDSGGDCVWPPYWGPFEVDVATATRWAAQAQCTTNDATDRLIDVVVYIGDTDITAASGGGALMGNRLVFAG